MLYLDCLDHRGLSYSSSLFLYRQAVVSEFGGGVMEGPGTNDGPLWL